MLWYAEIKWPCILPHQKYSQKLSELIVTCGQLVRLLISFCPEGQLFTVKIDMLQFKQQNMMRLLLDNNLPGLVKMLKILFSNLWTVINKNASLLNKLCCILGLLLTKIKDTIQHWNLLWKTWSAFKTKTNYMLLQFHICPGSSQCKKILIG